MRSGRNKEQYMIDPVICWYRFVASASRTSVSSSCDIYIVVPTGMGRGEVPSSGASSGGSGRVHLTCCVVHRQLCVRGWVGGCVLLRVERAARTAIRRAMVCAGLRIRRSRADRIAGRLRDAGAVRGLHSRRSCGRTARVPARC